MRDKKLRIAWFSNLPERGKGAETSSAWFTSMLAPLISRNCEIELFHDAFWSHESIPTFHFLTAERRHAERRFDIFFYNIEDDSSADFSRFHSGLIPGVTLFHDIVCLRRGPEPLLNSGWTAVVSKFNEPSAPWPARGEKFLDRPPLALREAALSLAPVFVSERDLIEYRSHLSMRLAGAIPPILLRSPVRFEPFRGSGGRGHRRIVFCGSPGIEHRAHKLLHALSDSGDEWELLWMIDPEERAQAELLLEEFRLNQCTFVEGRTPDRWSRILKPGDICIHTLFSAYGHPFPYLAISLMKGLPCLVSRFGHTEKLSEKIVMMIEPGNTEATQIRETLAALRSGTVKFDAEIVHEYARELFDHRAISEELELYLRRAARLMTAPLARWAELCAEARSALLDEAREIVHSSLAGNTSWLQPQFQELGWDATKGKGRFVG